MDALLCGPLSDRFGRKRVIGLCVFLFGTLSLASAFSPDLQALIFLRSPTDLGLDGTMPNTTTMISEYLSVRRRDVLVTLMFCDFTLGSALGGIVSAQLVLVIGWHGVLVLGGVLPLIPFVALLVVLPESPCWQVRRQLPQAVIAKTVSVITRECYVDTHFYFIESASVIKGSAHQLLMGRQLSTTLVLWAVFFISLLTIYLLSSWMPTLLNHRGIDLQHVSWVTATFQIGDTLGALALGVSIDKSNPFRVLMLSYATGAIYIVMIGLSQDGLWLMALAIFGTGIGTGGSQVGLNALTATFYPTQSRTTGVNWPNTIGRCGTIVGLLLGGAMMAMNFSFGALFFIIAIPAVTSAVMLALLIIVIRQSTSVPDSLPRTDVVNK